MPKKATINKKKQAKTINYGKRTEINYDNIKRRKNNGDLQNINIKQFSYKDAEVTIKQLIERATKFSTDLKIGGLFGTIQIEIMTPQGPRSGKAFDFGCTVDIYNPSEYESDIIEDMDGMSNLETWYDNGNAVLNSYNMFIIEKPTSGGADLNNDCLWNALYKSYNGVMPKLLTPLKLKSFLGIKRNEVVNSSTHIDNIEKTLARAINITGDIIRQSSLLHGNPINLNLCDGHYELQTNANIKKSQKEFLIERTFMIF